MRQKTETDRRTERERDRDRDRETETDRQTDRQKQWFVNDVILMNYGQKTWKVQGKDSQAGRKANSGDSGRHIQRLKTDTRSLGNCMRPQ